MIRLNHDIKRPALGAISLCTDPSNVTACGNDLGFEQIFARNVEGLGSEGDVLVAISTSGRSENVVLAVEAARRKGMRSICLLGGSGGALKETCDVAIVVPSSNTQRIQEAHITIGHVICESVEQLLHGES
jgi:D-sedoheptulose 7-phosphate isomerase